MSSSPVGKEVTAPLAKATENEEGLSVSQTSYTVSEQVYCDTTDEQHRHIEISYPELSDDIDQDIIIVNEAIKKEAFNYQLNEEGLTFLQQYSISRLSKEELSVVFQATPYVRGAAHPMDICHAITIDLVSGEKQNLGDFFESYDELKECVVNGHYTTKGSLCIYDKGDLWDQLQIFYTYTAIETHENDFFLAADGNVCLIISGLGHGAGDYSIIELEGQRRQRDGSSVLTKSQKGDDIPPNSEMTK